MSGKPKDVTGKRFGAWRAVKLLGFTSEDRAVWGCKHSCGKQPARALEPLTLNRLGKEKRAYCAHCRPAICGGLARKPIVIARKA